MARKDPRIEAAEDEMIACMRMLWRMPDRERGWMLSGVQAWWPAIIREQSDYPDDAEPRAPLRRGDVERVSAMFLSAGCHVEAIAPRDRKLVALVVARKAGRLPGGFRWDDVWKALGGLLPTGAGESGGRPAMRKVTADAMRKRYEDGIERVAVAMGLGADGRALVRHGL